MSDNHLPTPPDEDGFQSIFEVKMESGQAIQISFPLPEEMSPFISTIEYNQHAIDYYILARYSYFHKMHHAYIINSFWVVEYLCLSVLALHHTKADLQKSKLFHRLPSYWKLAKINAPPSTVSAMSKFDNYISKVQGYFSERYFKPSGLRGKLLFSGKRPKFFIDNNLRKFSSFSNVNHFDLEELDHFVNFMLHDVTTFKNDCSRNLRICLMRTDNIELYSRDNKFSVIHPNKKYCGELT